jgi:hypothetical protein
MEAAKLLHVTARVVGKGYSKFCLWCKGIQCENTYFDEFNENWEE